MLGKHNTSNKQMSANVLYLHLCAAVVVTISIFVKDIQYVDTFLFPCVSGQVALWSGGQSLLLLALQLVVHFTCHLKTNHFCHWTR